MNVTSVARMDALEQARRIHNEHIVIDSMSPNFITEWVLTPPMVELAKTLQAEGKAESEEAVKLKADITRLQGLPE